MTAAMLLLLLSPLVGGAVLALVGHRRYAAEVNVTFCLLTFGASAGLVARVIAQGPVTALGEEFFVDSLNVFLVALTAFVAMTTSLFSRPYMRIERDHGKMTPLARPRLGRRHAPVSQHVPAVHIHHAARPDDQ